MATSRDNRWLSSLNQPQLRAVTHGDAPLLIVAGAGTGKTMTLAYRVAYLISRGVPPERILLLTFTRRAAEEMLKRAIGAIQAADSVAGRVWSGTFHATANRLLRIYAGAAGLSPDFTIIDRADSEDVIDVIRNEMGLSTKGSRFPRKSACLEIYSRRVNSNETLDTVLKKFFPWCQQWENELKSLFRSYVDRKQRENILDYDDLLLYWYHLVQDESLASLIGGRFDHILVDEYQDTNATEAGILAGMRRTNRNLTVVGDDAQSIYGFRSASIRNMLDFPEQFPGATTVTLEQNYRSIDPILKTTNLVISRARERYSKTLWSARCGAARPRLITCQDESQQDEAVVKQVLEHYEQGIPLHRQAVLFRAAHHSASLELALARHNIPFRKYGGLRFLEASHVKDLVAILRILENPRDQVAWNRVLQLFEGVGPATAAAIFHHVRENGYRPDSITNFHGAAAAREELSAFANLLKDILRTPEPAPSVQIERISHFYDPVLKRRYDDAEQRANDIAHLGQLASNYQTRREFLSELVLDPPVSTGDFAGPPVRDEDWLVLSTIHSAKGLEWDAVYLIHAADGCLPSDMATGENGEIEEERRLTYVAMTRARDFLYVLWPLRYYHRTSGVTDRHSYAQCCRFFTPEVVESMEQVALAPAKGPSESSGAIPRIDVKSRIRDIWN